MFLGSVKFFENAEMYNFFWKFQIVLIAHIFCVICESVLRVQIFLKMQNFLEVQILLGNVLVLLEAYVVCSVLMYCIR